MSYLIYFMCGLLGGVVLYLAFYVASRAWHRAQAKEARYRARQMAAMLDEFNNPTPQGDHDGKA